MFRLTFRQTNSERMVRAAATVLFSELQRNNTRQVSISELAARPVYGFTASATAEPVGPKFVRITDLQDGKIDWDSVPFCECPTPERYLLHENDILFARTGATTGKTYLVKAPQPAVFASYLIRLSPKPNVDPAYLYGFFQSDNYWLQISEQKEGSAQSNVNGEKLANIKIPFVQLDFQRAVGEFLNCVRRRQDGDSIELPELLSPLAQKRRIVERIEEMADKIEEALNLRCQAIAEAEGLLAALSNRLFTQTPDHTPIESVAEVRGGIQKGPGRVPSANPVRYLTVTHVQRNKIRLEDPRYFEVTPDELQRWRLSAGDVLIIEGNGSVEQIGRTALFRGEIEDCVHQNHVIRIRPNPNKILPEFLNAYLNSPAGQEAVQSQSRTTSGLRTLSVGRIKQILVPAIPVRQQQEIMSKLDSFGVELAPLKQLQDETQTELDALFPAILDCAFKGEL